MSKLGRGVFILAILIFGSANLSYAVDLNGSLFSHDPATLIKDGDNYWHFFTAPGIGSAYSKDLKNWTSGSSRIFKTGSTWKSNYPEWTIPYFGSGESANTDGNLWAPDIIYMNGAYYLYYSCSSFGSSNSAIGCVKSTSLNSPNWQDMGKVVSSSSRADINAIDPGMFKDDDGKVYMVYGSFSGGIGIVEIDTITGLATTAVKHLAGGSSASYEAPALFKEDGYYYLVINRGSCCKGLESTYYLIVGRSTNVNGPYEDYRTLLPVTEGKYIGPGHFSLYRDTCVNYVTTHFYNGERNGFAQYDILRMKMINGWPVLSRDFSFDDCKINLSPSQLISISITEPLNNAVFKLDESINLKAEASHAEGEIKKVSFYVDNQMVAEDISEPYTFEITSIDAGVYNLYAVATDSNDLQDTSEPVMIQVGAMATFQENNEGYCGITNNAGSIDFNHLNYTGEGFINTDNATGSTVNWSVNIMETGKYSILFRYATSSNRPGKITINDVDMGTLDFNSTGSWDDWDYSTLDYTVTEAGVLNISVSATTGDGLGNIDFMRIIPLEGTSSPVGAECSVATEEPKPNSINIKNSSEKFTMYPIPVKNTLYINADHDLENISIYKADGTKIKFIDNINVDHIEIRCSDLGGAGLYILRTTIGNVIYTRKFTVIN